MSFGRLGWRLFAVCLVCGGIGLLASKHLLQKHGLRLFEPTLARDLVWRLDEAALTACARDPARWNIRAPNGVRYDAYHSATLKSANPEALPIERTLVDRLRAGEAHPATSPPPGSTWGIRMLVRGRRDGPCGLIQIVRKAQPEMTSGLRQLVIASVWLPILGALGGLLVLLGPLLRRIRRLKLAALGVGSADYRAIDERGRDELAAVAAALDRAHARISTDARLLEERRTASERFLQDIAHDLRGPIAALQLTLEELSDLLPGDPATRTLLRGALADVVYASSLVANLRLASRLSLTHSPPVMALVSLDEIADRVVRRHEIFARRRGQRVSWTRPPAQVTIEGDAPMIEQAVSNLLENAVAHGDEGGLVDVSLTTTDNAFRLQVADDGPGVAPEQLPSLAARSFRADEARQRDGHGSGLGLAIVTAVCERHGFSLSLANRPTRGLEAIVTGSCGARGCSRAG